MKIKSTGKSIYRLISIFVFIISLVLMTIGLGYFEKSGRYWNEYTTCLSNFDKNNEIDYFDRKNTDKPCQPFVNNYLNNEEISFDLMKVGFALAVIFLGGVIFEKKFKNKVCHKK